MVPNRVIQTHRLVRAADFTAIVFLAGLATWLQGKDVNWDLLNYHFYIAHAWWTDRLHQEFMAASLNSYLPAIGYLPFYWMVQANWHSLAIALVLSSIHALNLILIWLLVERFFFRDAIARRAWCWAAVLLAASCPVFLTVVGATFLEPFLALGVLGAWLLIAMALDNPDNGRRQLMIFLAGLLLGMALGAKLTTIVFAAATGIALCLVSARDGLKRAVVNAALFGFALVAGYALSNGAWAWSLYREFGNPVFPFFNGIFQSPDFIAANLDHDRFKRHDLWDLLTFPFQMADFYSWTYIENLSPDLRPAALLMSAIALLAVRIRRVGTLNAAAVSTTLGFIQIVFLGSCALWIATTSNGRYGLPVLLLVGPLLALTLRALIAKWQYALAACFLIVTLQAINLGFAGSQRWDVTGWTDSWFSVSVPERLKQEPYSYISLGSSGSNSFIIPQLHPKSEFASIAGATFAFDPAGPGSQRLHEQFARAGSRLRMLITARWIGTVVPAMEVARIDRLLAPWKLEMNTNDCEFISVALSPESENQMTGEKTPDTELGFRLRFRLLSCAVTPSAGESEATKAARARIERAFDKLEAYCPLLFSPRGWYLTNTGLGWHRAYLTSDIIVYERRGRLEYSRFEFGPLDVPLGSVESWLSGAGSMKCERPRRHFLLK
jgi:hypothetical protein